MNFFDAELVKSDGALVVDCGAFSVKLPEQKNAAYGNHVGKQVIFGIRPEDLHDPSYAPPGIHQALVESNVEVTELMGNEVFLYLNTSGKNYVGRVDPRSRARIGDKIQVAMNLDNMHLFDKETERAIR
jgi:multiple sugar transport system ATP-binding protein